MEDLLGKKATCLLLFLSETLTCKPDKGPSVNIDIYLETKTSRLGGRGLSASSFLEKYRCTFCMREHVQKKDQKYRYYVPFVCVRFSGRGG